MWYVFICGVYSGVERVRQKIWTLKYIRIELFVFIPRSKANNIKILMSLLFSWLWQNSKGISVLWSCFSLSLYLLQCCLLQTSLLCRALSLPCLPIFLFCLRSFSRWSTYSFCSCSWSFCSCSWSFCSCSWCSYRLLCPTTRYLWSLSYFTL